MSHDTAAILADTQAYGFVFTPGTVNVDGRGDKGTPYPNTPIVTVVNLPKFDAAFPGVALGAINGQSVRVGSQRIGREAREAGVRDGEEIKLRNVRWLLGIKVSAPTLIYVGPEGAKFATPEDAEAAWLDWAARAK
ncbi:MAG: hypothetical protein ACRET3_05060 [Burkholderiales bacterium]